MRRFLGRFRNIRKTASGRKHTVVDARFFVFDVEPLLSSPIDLSNYTVRHFGKSLEEFLEMVAISLLLMLFVRHLIKTVDSHLLVDFRGSQAME